MSRDRQRLADYLGHVVEAIERIGEYTAGMDERGFMSNRMVQDAVIRNLEIIGEASHNVEKHYPEFAAAHAELPLAVAYQMRNAIAHGYFTVDYAIVWRTIGGELPALKTRVQAAVAVLPRTDGDAER